MKRFRDVEFLYFWTRAYLVIRYVFFFCYVAGVRLLIFSLECLHFYSKVRVVHRLRSVLSLVGLGIRFLVMEEQGTRLGNAAPKVNERGLL